MKNKKILLISSIIFILIFIFGISYFYNNFKSNEMLENTNEPKTIEKYKNPIIPNGFKKVETDSASWEINTDGNPKDWNNGLVIEDEKGNQFVWVPCTLTGYNNTVQYSRYFTDSLINDTWEIHSEDEILTSGYTIHNRRKI